MAYNPPISLGGTPSQITYLSSTSVVSTIMVGAGAVVNSSATTTLSVGATVYSMCQSLDGNFLFVSTSTVINMYRKTGNNWSFVFSATHNLSTSIQTTRVSPNGRWLIAMNASTGLRLYAVTSNSLTLAQSYTTTIGSFNSCTWMPDSVFFVTSSSAGISVCYINNASTGAITFPTTATLSGGVLQVAYLPNEANKITLACAGTVSPYMKVVQFITIPGNGWATNESNGAYNSSTVFPTTIGYIYSITGASAALRSVAVNGAGTLFVGGTSSNLYTYNANPSNQNTATLGVSRIGAFTGIPYNLAFSPDGTQLMVGASNLSIAQITGNNVSTFTTITAAQPGTATGGSWGTNWTGN